MSGFSKFGKGNDKVTTGQVKNVQKQQGECQLVVYRIATLCKLKRDNFSSLNSFLKETEGVYKSDEYKSLNDKKTLCVVIIERLFSKFDIETLYKCILKNNSLDNKFRPALQDPMCPHIKMEFMLMAKVIFSLSEENGIDSATIFLFFARELRRYLELNEEKQINIMIYLSAVSGITEFMELIKYPEVGTFEEYVGSQEILLTYLNANKAADTSLLESLYFQQISHGFFDNYSSLVLDFAKHFELSGDSRVGMKEFIEKTKQIYDSVISKNPNHGPSFCEVFVNVISNIYSPWVFEDAIHQVFPKGNMFVFGVCACLSTIVEQEIREKTESCLMISRQYGVSDEKILPFLFNEICVIQYFSHVEHNFPNQLFIFASSMISELVQGEGVVKFCDNALGRLEFFNSKPNLEKISIQSYCLELKVKELGIENSEYATLDMSVEMFINLFKGICAIVTANGEYNEHGVEWAPAIEMIQRKASSFVYEDCINFEIAIQKFFGESLLNHPFACLLRTQCSDIAYSMSFAFAGEILAETSHYEADYVGYAISYFAHRLIREILYYRDEHFCTMHSMNVRIQGFMAGLNASGVNLGVDTDFIERTSKTVSFGVGVFEIEFPRGNFEPLTEKDFRCRWESVNQYRGIVAKRHKEFMQHFGHVMQGAVAVSATLGEFFCHVYKDIMRNGPSPDDESWRRIAMFVFEYISSYQRKFVNYAIFEFDKKLGRNNFSQFLLSGITRIIQSKYEELVRRCLDYARNNNVHSNVVVEYLIRNIVVAECCSKEFMQVNIQNLTNKVDIVCDAIGYNPDEFRFHIIFELLFQRYQTINIPCKSDTFERYSERLRGFIDLDERKEEIFLHRKEYQETLMRTFAERIRKEGQSLNDMTLVKRIEHFAGLLRGMEESLRFRINGLQNLQGILENILTSIGHSLTFWELGVAIQKGILRDGAFKETFRNILGEKLKNSFCQQTNEYIKYCLSNGFNPLYSVAYMCLRIVKGEYDAARFEVSDFNSRDKIGGMMTAIQHNQATSNVQIISNALFQTGIFDDIGIKGFKQLPEFKAFCPLLRAKPDLFNQLMSHFCEVEEKQKVVEKPMLTSFSGNQEGVGLSNKK